MSGIVVKHNIEVAHRLIATPGKCEAIHGHSMWVELHLGGKINPETGMLVKWEPDQGHGTGHFGDLEFGAIKKSFRAHLDEQYDHRLLLNASDPFAGPIFRLETMPGGGEFVMPEEGVATKQEFLPGLAPTIGDPTTENIARWIYEWAQGEQMPVAKVKVWETSVNMAMFDGA